MPLFAPSRACCTSFDVSAMLVTFGDVFPSPFNFEAGGGPTPSYHPVGKRVCSLLGRSCTNHRNTNSKQLHVCTHNCLAGQIKMLHKGSVWSTPSTHCRRATDESRWAPETTACPGLSGVSATAGPRWQQAAIRPTCWCQRWSGGVDVNEKRRDKPGCGMENS